MREIKFRAWHKKLEEYLSRDGRSWHRYGPNIVDGILRSEDCIIEQFTGLHDKNGKEIYEGDIVIYINSIYRNSKYLLEYEEGCYWLDSKKDNLDVHAIPLDTGSSESVLEVIGNIHENPELIK